MSAILCLTILKLCKLCAQSVVTVPHFTVAVPRSVVTVPLCTAAVQQSVVLYLSLLYFSIEYFLKGKTQRKIEVKNEGLLVWWSMYRCFMVNKGGCEVRGTEME